MKSLNKGDRSFHDLSNVHISFGGIVFDLRVFWCEVLIQMKFQITFIFYDKIRLTGSWLIMISDLIKNLFTRNLRSKVIWIIKNAYLNLSHNNIIKMKKLYLIISETMRPFLSLKVLWCFHFVKNGVYDRWFAFFLWSRSNKNSIRRQIS